MPAVDCHSGQILLARPDRITSSPDGHGGTLDALERAGLLQMLEEREIDQLFYFQVDNPLVSVADPIFLGYHLLADSEMTTQVVAKQDPLEKVGNLVDLDGVLRIIEYSDLPESVARRRQPDGSLVFWAGSIAVHAFSVPFLQRMARDSQTLPFHRATKRVPYIDDQGKRITPTEPNAIKFERFIFDILPHAKNALVVEVDPKDAFAPVKNQPGSATDTPETAQRAMMEQCRRWLRQAGVSVSDTCRIEIHPCFAADVDDLRRKIVQGTTLDVDTYFH
jgi:UDP-N-acetylglucosamine/UDP-N-acetylgalactosamine diphosphorylase